MSRSQNTNHDFTDPDFRDQNLAAISPVSSASQSPHWVGDRSTSDSSSKIFDSTSASPQVSYQTSRSSSTPYDETFEGYFVKYITELSEDPTKTESDRRAVKIYLTEIFNQYVKDRQPNSLSKDDCETTLANKSQDYWKIWRTGQSSVTTEAISSPTDKRNVSASNLQILQKPGPGPRLQAESRAKNQTVQGTQPNAVRVTCDCVVS